MLLGPIVGAPIEEWRRMVDLNLLGLLYCTHAALPHLFAPPKASPERWPTWSTSARWPGACAGRNGAVYSATKFGVGAFSESLRQEVATRHVRVTLIEPGATETELASHNRPEVLEQMADHFVGLQRLDSDDIANGIRYAVTQPRHVAVNEILIRPSEQER